MKSRYYVLLVVGLLMSVPLQADEPARGKIQWVKDLETAMRMSRDQDRPVMAYFTFDACVWCKRLEKACFDDPDVVKLSRDFIWVTVNRDHTPEIPKRLNVSAYPSMLTLGLEEENVYRFQSYQEPPEFFGNLKAALQRYALYKQGKDWVIPPQRAPRIVDGGEVSLLKAPSQDVPGGITVLDDWIWVAQRELYKLNAKTGEVAARFPLPSSVGDLCTDGKNLYALTYGWTAGKPIYVISPQDGHVIREIITEANKQNRAHGAKGIAWRDGRLFVLSGMTGKLHSVDPQTGKIVGETQLSGTWLSGLDFRGDHLVLGSRTHIHEFDAKTGKLIRKTVCNYPVRNLAAHGQAVWLMEQPVFGFGPKHERIQVWPQTTQIYRWSETPAR